MNKLRYRIVFNQARGMCMVVAETARSQSKGPGQGLAAMPAPGVMRLPALRRMALLIGIGFSGVLLGDGALAQIVADPNAPGQQRATVLNAANGVPQVNIQTPSAAGVSRNVYSQFDVPKSGAILNNSRTNVQTQLGGWVQGNPWLGNGTARVILNEVRSSNPSRLQGYIEVAGDRAETIIANPAGIVVDGGGFINVSRATLTTGSPVFEDGRLKGYSVQRGQIVVDGAGLDASRTDYAALIARSLQVNAGLWAQRLDVITGVNDVAASAQATVTQTRQASDAAPLYAVDVAQLGGMYANQIYLVGTEAGVGVRNAGATGAAAGDLVVTASCRLENSGSLSADQRLQTSAIGIDNQGSMQAGQTLALTAGSLVNAGQLASGKEALIVVQGEVDNNGGRIEAQRIDLTGDTLRNARGSIVQAGAQGFAIEATGVANNTGVLGKQSVPAAADAGGSAGADNGVSAPADTVASGNIGNSGNGAGQDGPAAGTGQPSTPMPALADGRLQVRLLDNASGAITANGETVLRAGTLENRGGQMLVSSLSVSGPDVDNTGGVLTILRSFDVHTQRFINDQGRLLVGAAFDGALGAFSNRQGLLQATRLSVDVAEQLDNSGGTLRQLGATQALLTVGGEMALDNGTLDMGGALHLRTGTLSGSGSTLNVTGDLSFDSGAASSAQGRWTIGGNADLRTGALDNSGGAISAARALNITGGLLANTGGTIASGIDAVVRAHGDVENSGGTIQAARDLVLEASGQIQNRAGSIGTLDSGSSLTMTGAAIDNGDGRIANAGSGRTTLAAGSIANRGLIGGNGEMGIAAHVLRNDAGGSITSQGGLELALDAVLANAGRIEAGGRLQMNQATAQLNNSGKLVAQGDVTITATSVDNSAGTIATAAGSGNALSLTAGSLVNRAGTIQADGTAQLAVRGDVVNEAGRIRASIGLLLDAGGRIENRNGGIESAAGMLLHGAEIGNDGGTIAASGLEASVVEADRSIDNNGLIGVNGQLTLKARTLASGAAGVINAGGDLELAVSGALVNRGGSIGTAGTLNFDQAQATLLNSGALTAGMGLRLNLDQVDNRGGALNSVQGSGLDLTTNALDNRGGRLMADGDVAVQVRGAADNGGGVLQAAGSLDARIDGALRNQAGVIEALGVHGTLDLRAAGIDNADGRIAGVGDGATNISAAGHIASSGLIAGNGQLNIVATSLETTGVISAGAGIELAVSRAVDNAGTISAAAMLHMDQAQAGLCNSGTLVAGGPLALSVAALENAGGRIATARGSNANILVSAHAIGNQDGAIVADRDATLAVVDGIDGRGGLLQARGQLQLDAGGVVDISGGGIETLSADSTLQLHAGALLNEAGRIVNAGGGDTRVQANTMLVNSGELSGNGALHVDAQSVVNKAGGNMVAGSELALHAQALLDNTGTISSGAGLSLDAADAALVNHGTIAANADIAIRAGAVDNDGGTVATASGSGAGVTLQAASLSNRSGSIVAERGLALGVDAALDNSQGRLGGVTTVQVTTGATLSNDGGVIEASGTDATLALRADAIDNGSGRIVNVGRGRTDVSAAGRLTSDGLVAGNGALDLQAATLVNGRSGTLASGQAMTTTFSTRFENAGSVNSGSTLDLAARTAEVRNSGLIVANGALTLASDVFDNAGGQLATARGSGAGLALDAANIVNRGGSILSDRDAQLHSAGGFDNAQGTLQAAGSLRLSAAASVENDGGAIEALDPAATLVVQAGALDNGSGRIVNTGSNATSVSVAGGFVNRGLVAGNGNLALAFGMLDNQAGGSIASGGSLRIDAGHSIANAGAISSQDALTLDAAAATVANHGSVASGSDVTLHAHELSNAGGTVAADGAVRIVAGGAFDNRGGAVRAATAMDIDAVGSLGNQSGVIEVTNAAAALNVHAASIDNSAGRLANIGSGATRITATNDVVNGGTVAGNGSVHLSAQAFHNQAGGTIAAGTALDLQVRQALDNAGRISAGATLSMDQAQARIVNSGEIVAAGSVTLHGASIANDGGQIATVSGTDIVLGSESTLSNRSGTISAAGNAALNAHASFDNTQGQVQALGQLRVSANGALTNAGGTLESTGASGTLALQAGSIDNAAGRIVNAGTDPTTVDSAGTIVNSGTIGGNGALALSAQDVRNVGGGTIVSGGALELTVQRQLDNLQGTISSGGALTFDQSAARFTNTGRISAGGAIDIAAAAIDNRAGQVYTVNGSGAAVDLRTASLDNTGGMVSADGMLRADVAGNVSNSDGTIHGGTGTALDVQGALDNGSGVIETAAGTLAIHAQSLGSSGRIINAGTGATTITSAGAIANSGLVAGSGTLELHASSLVNLSGGEFSSGGALLLDGREQLTNAGVMTSGGALAFDRDSATFTNSGRIGAAGAIGIVAATVNNHGGQLYTANDSGAMIDLRANSLDNTDGTISADGLVQVDVGDSASNGGGLVHGGSGTTFNVGGALANGSGTIEAAGGALAVQAQSIDSSGRLINAGSGATAITSAGGIINAGTIASNGSLVLSGQTLQNASAGSIGAGAALDLQVRELLDNQGGAISSGGSLRFDQATASFINSGRIGAGGAIDISAATIGNHGGQLYTVNQSGAAINLNARTLDNSGGTVSADGLLRAEVAGDVTNGGGALHGGAGLELTSGGALANGSGTIEAAAGALDIQAQSVESSGRIVNAGAGLTTLSVTNGITNSGAIAGNGALDLHAKVLSNLAGGQMSSGHALTFNVRQQLSNAGAISTGGTLSLDQATVTFANSGRIVAAADIRLASASFDNTGGQISTVTGSGSDITVTSAALNNHGGAILADGAASFTLAGVVDNSHGTLQAGADLTLTTSGTISNGDGVIETLGAGSSLTLAGESIDNGSGRIVNAGSGDTRLLSQTSIVNGGTIAGMGNLLLSGQTLSNKSGATLASGKDLALAITGQLANQGKINSAGAFTFDQGGASFTNSGEIYSGGNAIIHAGVVNNDGGRLGTGSGSGADLVLTAQQLSNQGGRIATDRDLLVDIRTVSALGELFGGRDLDLSLDGDFVQNGGVQQIRANRNLSLSVSGSITNASALEAAGTLTLSAQQISNQAGATIAGQDVILNASGNLANAGDINGEDTLAISAANVANNGGIIGGNVAVVTANLDNAGSTALIGATGSLGLGVTGTLNNTGGATLYSSGDLTIGACDCGSTDIVNNVSSTIEAGGNLAINADTLNNVRENVQIVQVKTVDETVHMTMPSWYQYGDNHNAFETTAANYRPREVYFVNPSDILEHEIIYTPDGRAVHRAVIRTHANDSAFYVAVSGIYSANYGTQRRLILSEGTRVIYYTENDDQVANPDQGGPASDALVHANDVTHWDATVSFSNQYGNCSSDCIRMVTQPGYDDPRTTRLLDTIRWLGPIREQMEVSSDAHHVAIEDRVAPGAGAVAQILSGGNMHLTVGGALENRFGDIKAKGTLVIDGAGTRTNVGATLYRTHNFDGTWYTYAGQAVSYQQPSISEEIGAVRGIIEGGQGVSITGRNFSNVDVTAGTVGNIRETVNVIGSGATGAGTSDTHVSAHTSIGGAVGGNAVAVGNGDGLAGVHVAAGAGVSGLAGGQVSGGAAVADVGVSGEATASGGGSGLSTGPHAATNGNANAFQSGDKIAGSAYANDAETLDGATTGGDANNFVAHGAVAQSGASNNGRLGGAVSAARNDVRLGSVRANAGPSLGQEAANVHGAGLGSIVKVALSGLFIRNPDTNGSYLFETRPQFANQQQWTSSDYLLKQLAYDPATTQKRLGDGFYEQRLVREQLAELTGHVLYSGASDDSTYKALLTNGVSVAREFGLRPGVALSAEQVSRLTSDIVWMETQTVMLPAGSTETVLAPKVYLAHVDNRALQPGGALVAGNGVTINTTESIANKGGVIDGGNGRTMLVAAQDIVNQGGTIKGGTVGLMAQGDVRNESLAVTQAFDFGPNSSSHTSLSNQASIKATGALEIVAGRDLSDLAGQISAGSADISAGRNISFGTIQTGSTYQSQINGYTEKNSSITHQLSQVSTTGDLRIAAMGDLNLSGAQVAIGTAGSGAGQLLAGGSINIDKVVNEANSSLQNDPRSKQYDKQVHQNQTVVGAAISATGGLTVAAGLVEKGAINVTGSSLVAGEALNLSATDNINIVSTQEQYLSDTASTRTSSSFMKSKTSQQADYFASSQAIGSTLSGKTVEVSAGKDINVLGSAIAGDGDVTLAAGGSVNIKAATSTLTEQHHTKVKESGILSGDGFGFSYGTRTTTTDQSRDATVQSGQSRSMVGSLGGNLNIIAGDAIKVNGSDLAAGMDMVLDGRSITVDPGRDNSNGKVEQTTVQDGLTLAIGGSVVNAIQTFQGMSSAASQSKDTRIRALAASAAAMAAKDAVDDVTKNGPNVRVSLMVGHSESKNTELTTDSNHSGSVFNAGKNVTLRATGGGQTSNIDIIGSDVHVSGNILLAAENQVNLLAAHDTESQHSQSKSMSAAIGVAAEIGSKTQFGLTASASASRGNVDGEGTTQVNSHVTAGDGLTISTGGDLNLKGAVASGNRVITDVKGNLNIESLQDTATLDGRRQSLSVSGTIGPASEVSASVSLSRVHNDYASVQEQSGIRAGDGGFQVQVAGNTDLKGGVISSSDNAIKDGNNSLTTATLSFRDIQNRDRSDASGVNLGTNVGKNQSGSSFSPSIAPGIGLVSASQDSITRSGVSGGTLTIATSLGQTTANLNRNVQTDKDTAQALTKSWTGAQALEEVNAQMQITSTALPRLAKEIGDYAAIKVDELKTQGNLDEAQKWEEGGAYRVAAHAVLGAMGAGLEGALGAGSSAAAAPFIGKSMTNLGLTGFARVATVTAVGASIGAAVGGTSGAVTGTNQIANNYLKQHSSGIKRSEQAQFDYAVVACNNGDQSACERRDKLIILSQQRDQLITNACALGLSADCNALINEATRAGNKIIFGSDGKATIYPLGSPEVRATPNVQEGTLHDQLAKSTLDGLLMVSGDAAVAKAASLVGKGVIATVNASDNLILASSNAVIKATNLAGKGVDAVVDVAKGLHGGSDIDAGEQAIARLLNNFHSDGAPADLIEKAFHQAAISSTHNSSALEVVLGKYIRGSVDSYDEVAKARNATYFSMSDWATVESQLGAEKMWNVNKMFLDQQIAQGKKFLFTGNPMSALPGSFTQLEYLHLSEKGYKIVFDGKFYHAIK